MNKKMTLRSRFILTSYLSIVFSVVLICLVSYVLLSRNSRKYAVQAGHEAVRQKSEDISTKLQGLEMTVRDVIYSPEVQKALGSRDWTRDEKSGFGRSVDHMIALSANSLYMIHNLVIFSLDGSMVGSMFEYDRGRKADTYSWYQTAAESGGETIWLKDTVEMIRDNYGLHMSISGVKKIRTVYHSDITSMGQDLGYVYFTMNLDSLLNFNQPESVSQGRAVLVAAQDGRILGESGRKRQGTWFDVSLLQPDRDNTYVTIEGNQYLLTLERTSSSVDWYTVCLTERSYMLKDARTAIFFCGIVAVVLLMVFFCISVQNAESLSRPIKRLQKEFEMVEEGNFDIELRKNTGLLEVDSLFSRFHVMVYRLDDLIHKVYEARIKEQKLIAEARQAQLKSLQMQINPHFLYNTLDSINWLALMEGNEEISRMILALGHLLRSSISTFDIQTTVREEVENVKLYLFLEQVRFEDKLDFQVDAQEEVLDKPILKYTLQPLVENSIKHGMEPCPGKGKIIVSITGREGRLCIVVRDDGMGMGEEKLTSLRQMWEEIDSLEESARESHESIGIRNIMKRLWFCYGRDSSFFISSRKGEGTSMEIRIPM